MKLFERVPPPARARGRIGDRADAEAKLGYAFPAWDVVEQYGDGRWLDWLLVPSPHVPDGIEQLATYLDRVTDGTPGARLIAYTDPKGTFVYANADDDRVHVLVDETSTATGLVFGEFVDAWLAGTITVLPPVAELTGDPALAPYFTPEFDPTRQSYIAWVELKGADADRWRNVLPMFGGHTVMSRLIDEGRLQERIYIPSLEAQILFDLINGPKLHVRFYDDRRADVRALVYSACDAAGMTIWKTHGPRKPDQAL